jgi:hypothetical protein
MSLRKSYLLSIETTDLNTTSTSFAVVQTSQDFPSDLACNMFAQMHMGEAYNDDRDGFGNDEFNTQAIDAKEITEDECNFLRRTGIAKFFESVDYMKENCNMDEVEKALSE